uniref:Transmembrane protein n=1 Tax=Panagrellus redivivus TaxID=6233 RepID=A0A7E4UZQ0_PANRE
METKSPSKEKSTKDAGSPNDAPETKDNHSAKEEDDTKTAKKATVTTAASPPKRSGTTGTGTTPDSSTKRNLSLSRKKAKDFIHAHRSRAASSRRAKSTCPNDEELNTCAGTQPTMDGVAPSPAGHASPRASLSSSSKRAGLKSMLMKKGSSFKDAMLGSARNSPRSSTFKRNRACRQKVSMEKPITQHPMPLLGDDEQQPLGQLGVSHVVVRKKLDHKQLEAEMRRRNRCYRVWSIYLAFFAVIFVTVFIVLSAVGVYRVFQLYIWFGVEMAVDTLSKTKWSMEDGQCLTLGPIGSMLRRGKIQLDYTTCTLPFEPASTAPWSSWTDCDGRDFRYRHRVVGEGQLVLFDSVESFIEKEWC